MEKDRQYILDNSVMVPESGCWLWNKSWMATGYGQFQKNNKHFYAHRFSFETFVGPIPEGMFVCHKCDTPSCVNPTHLFAGTQQDNIQDASKKNRLNTSKGSKQHLAKLDEDKVKYIRQSKDKNATLAKELGVDPSVISEVKRHKIWRHV